MASDIAQPGVLPAAPEPPGADRTALAGLVASELEAIFGEPVERPAARAAARSLTAAASPPRGGASAPRRLTPATLGALTAATLAGVAAGSLFRMPAETGGVPGPPPTPLRVAAAAPRSEPPPLTVLDTSSAPPAPRAALARTTGGSAQHPVRAKVRGHGTARACCVHAGVTAADRRLHAAYQRAIRAGVPRAVLADYRDRWARLRRTSGHEPQRLVRGYAELKRGLVRAADAAHARRPSHRLQARWSFRPRYAPWWS